jgi:hypothetical protein
VEERKRNLTHFALLRLIIVINLTSLMAARSDSRNMEKKEQNGMNREMITRSKRFLDLPVLTAERTRDSNISVIYLSSKGHLASKQFICVHIRASDVLKRASLQVWLINGSDPALSKFISGLLWIDRDQRGAGLLLLQSFNRIYCPALV